MKYEDLTQEQKELICNGCGGKGGYFKPPHNKLFVEDCNRHDFDYHVGCTWLDRLKADWELRKNMRKRIRTTNIEALRDCLYIDDRLIPNVVIRQIYYRWCDAYFAGVVVAGRHYFYYAATKRTVI